MIAIVIPLSSLRSMKTITVWWWGSAIITSLLALAATQPSRTMEFEKLENSSFACSQRASGGRTSLIGCSAKCKSTFPCMGFLYDTVDSTCKTCGAMDRRAENGRGTQYWKAHMDCSHAGASYTGFLFIRPTGSPGAFFVHCQEGWTIIQRRINGTLDFNRPWAEYKQGFGTLDGEMWLGNEHIHYLTNQAVYNLNMNMTAWGSFDLTREHASFKIDDEGDNYKLHVTGTGEYTTLEKLDGEEFTTLDCDNDPDNINCGEYNYGGWWYRTCGHVLLNSLYPYDGECDGHANRDHQCMRHTEGNNVRLLKSTVMKVRRVPAGGP